LDWLEKRNHCRAARPLEDKNSYILFDFVDNYWEHGLPNREHDWKSHFIGLTKKERKEKGEGLEKQFMLRSEAGEIFISNLAKLPNGFKGQILQEVDPLNTKHAEILRKRQEKLDEIERKKREKEEAIERKYAEIQRRKEEKLAAIQRIKDEKLAEIQRRKDAIEAERLRKIAVYEAKIQKKIELEQAKKQKIEDARLARIREEERREESWRKSRVIARIQSETYYKRKAEKTELSRVQEQANTKRREVRNDLINRLRDSEPSSWKEYYQVQEENERQMKSERTESNRQAQLQRMEIQFEIGIRMTHSPKDALQRVFSFCSTKRYPLPTVAQLTHITQVYWEIEDLLFTKSQFDNALSELEKYYSITI
jgi:hypothetical protein